MILYFLLLSIKLHLFTRKEKAYWIGGLLHRFSSSDYAELTEHSGSTDYARILNGWSTCSVWGRNHFFMSHRFGFPFGRRFSIHRFSQISRVKGGWRVVKGRAQPFTRTNSLDTDIYAIPVKSEECFWSCTVKVFREKFWRLGDKVLSLPTDSKTNNQTELW